MTKRICFNDSIALDLDEVELMVKALDAKSADPSAVCVDVYLKGGAIVKLSGEKAGTFFRNFVNQEVPSRRCDD